MSRSVTPDDGIVSKIMTKISPDASNKWDAINLKNAKNDSKQTDSNIIFIQNEKLAFKGYTDQ